MRKMALLFLTPAMATAGLIFFASTQKNAKIDRGIAQSSSVTMPLMPLSLPYCEKDYFLARKLPAAPALGYRVHAFKIGNATLAGIGVGFTMAEEIIKISQAYTNETNAQNRYSTWYVSENNGYNQKTFFNHPLNSVKKGHFKERDREKLVNSFEAAFESMLMDDGLISKIEATSYFGVGCDSQKHRGPTMFAMLLAFSGCSAAQASDIANAVWALNGVPADLRLQIAERAAALGDRYPAQRARLAQVLVATPPSVGSPLALTTKAELSPFDDRVNFEKQIEARKKRVIRESKFQDKGIKFFISIAPNLKLRRAKSYSELLRKIQTGLSYEEAVQDSLSFWQGQLDDKVFEIDYLRIEKAYLQERLAIAKLYSQL